LGTLPETATMPTMKFTVPVLLAFGAAVILAVVVGLLVLEGVLILEGAQPITWYTRCAIAAYPGWAIFTGFVVSNAVAALLAHLYWHQRVKRMVAS
jgi:hypothetical protein